MAYTANLGNSDKYTGSFDGMILVLRAYLVQRPAALSSLSVLTALLESLKSMLDIFAASSAADERTF
jgi:hypothetical protein